MGDGASTHPQRARILDRNDLIGIYEAYHQPIYSYIYRRVGDVETARDLAADVFRRLLLVIQKGSGPEKSTRAWLYRCAHNIVIDHYRSQKHRQHLPLNEGLSGSEVGPEKTVEDKVAAKRVREAIAYLTPDQQLIITLKFFDGLSNEEVASISHKTIGAVKSLQHRALAALHRRLAFDDQVSDNEIVIDEEGSV